MPDSITNLLVTLGDGQRQRVLKAFLDARSWELPANAIAERCAPLSRPAVSHHLSVMRRTNVLTARREGKSIYYSINRPYIEQAFQSFLAFLDVCCVPSSGSYARDDRNGDSAMKSDALVAGEERYRRQIEWDDAKWVTHCVNCSPGNCPFRAYIKDGRVLREEQSGTLPQVEPGVPDMNPMGCQKGAAWSRTLDAPTRIPYPMRRKGARGAGEWERITWDEALTQIADTMIDTIQQSGPEAIVQAGTAGEGGLTAGFLFEKLINRIGGTSTDTNGDIGDFSVGTYLTFGQAAAASSFDDWFHSELLLIWHRNPVYTAIPHYHYIAEARYRGAEVVTIAPDYSPSAMHADYYAGVRPGTDAALALAMARVVIDEGLMDEAFVRSQTDLPLLVRSDTGRFLRGSDVEEGGRADQFYVWSRDRGHVGACLARTPRSEPRRGA